MQMEGYDYLAIGVGPNVTIPSEVIKLTASKCPSSVLLGTSKAWMKFKSSWAWNDKGYVLLLTSGSPNGE